LEKNSLAVVLFIFYKDPQKIKIAPEKGNVAERLFRSTGNQQGRSRRQRALTQLCLLQAKYQNASDPALRFLAFLQAALPADAPMWRTAGARR